MAEVMYVMQGRTLKKMMVYAFGKKKRTKMRTIGDICRCIV